MVLISDLVSAIAEVEGMSEATVALMARNAREAGYLSQGARGRNAPKATVTDCTNLLIAVNACGCLVKDSAAAIEKYRRLHIHAPMVAAGAERSVTVEGKTEITFSPEYLPLTFLERRPFPNLGEVIEHIVGRFIDGELERFLIEHGQYARMDVEFVRPRPAARVVFEKSGHVLAKASFYPPAQHLNDPVPKHDRVDRTIISHLTFLKIAEIMRA